MSRMFVANASKQRFEFHYKLPGQDKRRMQVIEPMSQIMIADENLQPEDVNAIVEQHSAYGFMELSDVLGGRADTSRVVLMHSEQPISAVAIRNLYDGNTGLLDAAGRQLRKEAAIATNRVLETTLDGQRNQGLDADIGNVQMSVQQEEPSGGYGENPIAEGYKVEDDAPSKSRRGR